MVLVVHRNAALRKASSPRSHSSADSGTAVFEINVTSSNFNAANIEKENAERQLVPDPTEGQIYYESTNQPFFWNLDAFTSPSSSTYSNYLANLSALLSASAYGYSNVRRSLRNLGFSDITPNNYNVSNYGTVAFTLAHKKLIVGGKIETLVAVVIRGTVGSKIGPEWRSNYKAWPKFNGYHSGFWDCYVNLNSNLNIYTNNVVNPVDSNSLRMLVTGHSRGAAAANILGEHLNTSTQININNLHVYTFACPYTKMGGISIGYSNIFNIINIHDKIKYIPPFEGYYRVGIPRYFNGSDKNPDPHSMAYTYVPWMLTHTAEHFVSDNKGIGFKWGWASVECPVDVELYDENDNLLGRIINNVPDFDPNSDIFMVVENDVKHIFYMSDIKYILKLTGTDDGTMTYTVSEIDSETGEETQKQFSNVKLFDGKQMQSFFGDDIDTSGIQLFVYENGAKVFEIDENGTERKITDASPEGEITIGANKWTSFLNTITFGLFFKNTQTATITADGGDVTVEYFLSPDILALEELEALTEWQVYGGAIGLDPNSKYIVYAKLTGMSGDPVYISSGGVVIYTGSEALTHNISYAKGSGENQAADVRLNGNTVQKIMSGPHILESGKDYAVSNETIIFNADYLESLEAGEYTLTVYYNPLGLEYVDAAGNDAPATTAIALTVLPAAAVELKSIIVSTLPDKMTYTVGETLDLSSMVVTAVYSDGSEKPVEDYITTPAQGEVFAEAGKQTVIVSYAEDGINVTADFEIIIKEPGHEHDYGTYEEVITAATCIEAGEMGIYCSDCGALLGTYETAIDPDNCGCEESCNGEECACDCCEPIVFACAVKTLTASVGVQQTIAYSYSGPESGKPVFSSSNAGICAVDGDGVLTPIKAGMAIVTVKCGAVTVTIVVTVK